MITEKIETFNKKWRGKKVYFCEHIGNTLNFNPNEFTFCCSSTTGKYPKVYDVLDSNFLQFTKEDYIDAMIRVFEENQSENGMCRGCEKLVKLPFQEWDENQIKVKNIIWNHFRSCNSHCVYCDETHYFKKFYEPIDIVDRLDQERVIADQVSISFGGGEPTLLDNLKDYIELGIRKKWPQILNTSGLLNREYIKTALAERDDFSVQISVDSGTPETYRKVKGQSGFEVVWNTIKDYCTTGGRVFAKYIIFSYNSEKKEIDAFIEQCVKAGVNNISISAEAAATFQFQEDLPWTYGEPEMKTTAYLLAKALQTNRAVFLYRGNLSSENFHYIFKRVVNDYLKKWIEERKLCIWGMGEYGKKLYDLLDQFNMKVHWFGDGNIEKQNTKYGNSQCLSLKELQKKSLSEKICILLAISYYEKVYIHLSKELPDADIRVLNIL